MVDATMLEAARRVVQSTMLDTIRLGSVTTTHDRYGATTRTFVAASTTPAQLRTPTVSEQKRIDDFRDAGILGTETIALVLPYGTSPTEYVATADNRVWRVVWTGVTPGLAIQVEAIITLEALQ